MEKAGEIMNRIKGCITLVSIAIMACGTVLSQTRSELEQQKKDTQREIEYTHSILEETRYISINFIF